MDNTGSTSFILFDRNVSNYVGRSVQDLIDAQGQVEDNIFGDPRCSNCIIFMCLLSADFVITTQGGSSLGYPSALDVLIGKQMLFKVEITNGNLLHGWRNYGVKRTSDDADLINQFIKRHDLKVMISMKTILSVSL